MTVSHHGAKRLALVCAAGVAFAASVTASRTVAQTAMGMRGPEPSRPPAAAPVTEVAARRDPFAGGLSEQPAPTSSPLPAASVPPIPAALGPLPANAGALGTGFAAPGRVSAIATGAHSIALIEDGGTTRLISVGDLYDGRHIAAIDAAGVHLDDRTLLPLSHASPVPPVTAPVRQR